MNNPFQTLGVSESATEKEITSAYHKLAKQYHPDLHPNDQNAEKKMKEINEAYAEAIRLKKSGQTWQSASQSQHQSYGQSYGQNGANWGGYNPWGQSYRGQQQTQQDPFGGFWGFGFDPRGSYQQQRTTYSGRASVYDDPELQAASDRISRGQYREAQQVLSSMMNRSAAWHYLSALASQGLGRKMDALSHARQAVQMDPGNQEYQSLLRDLQGSGQFYRSTGGGGTIGDALCQNPCMTILAVNVLLNCLCGGRFMMCC
ncbi:MAG: DnaJ domain-containing protein [Clostridia bacterium]|nr:DnaJ domain-containing protein [Clostridia bacterium]